MSEGNSHVQKLIMFRWIFRHNGAEDRMYVRMKNKTQRGEIRGWNPTTISTNAKCNCSNNTNFCFVPTNHNLWWFGWFLNSQSVIFRLFRCLHSCDIRSWCKEVSHCCFQGPVCFVVGLLCTKEIPSRGTGCRAHGTSGALNPSVALPVSSGTCRQCR